MSLTVTPTHDEFMEALPEVDHADDADRADEVDGRDMPWSAIGTADDEIVHEPLSTPVAALIGIAALALSAICTMLLLTFASTTLDGTSLLDGPSSSVLENYGG